VSAVLVADDELGMPETLIDILSQSGYDVSAAADGDGALDAIRTNRFDVVLMDIRMPGRDGVSVLREVGEPPPQVILMTAYAKERHMREARETAFAIVNKPGRVPQLLDPDRVGRRCGRVSSLVDMTTADTPVTTGSVLVVDVTTRSARRPSRSWPRAASPPRAPLRPRRRGRCRPTSRPPR
jgi:CheY-like chemotaxis protein